MLTTNSVILIYQQALSTICAGSSFLNVKTSNFHPEFHLWERRTWQSATSGKQDLGSDSVNFGHKNVCSPGSYDDCKIPLSMQFHECYYLLICSRNSSGTFWLYLLKFSCRREKHNLTYLIAHFSWLQKLDSDVLPAVSFEDIILNNMRNH